MKIKKLLCVLLTLCLCVAVFAACTKKPAEETDATTVADNAEETTAAEDAEETTADEAEAADAEDPTSDVVEIAYEDRTTANLAGTYGFERCTITAEAIDENTMKFTVHWGSSASEAAEWEMTGMFDPDTLRVNYSDCVSKNVVYSEDGTGTETVEYENGVGRMQFLDLNSLIWQDEQDNVAAGITFTKNAPAE